MPDAQLLEEIRNYLRDEVMQDPGYDLEFDEPLISSGLIDSFSLVDIAMYVEETYGVEIDNSELNADNFDTVKQFAAYIETHR